MVREDVIRYTIKRLVSFVPVWLGISFISFSIIHIAPGSAVDALLAIGARTPENIARVRAEWGLDQPFHIQYLDWVVGFVQGDLGTSFATGQPVLTVIANGFMPSLQLATVAWLLAASMALPMGILAGVYPDSWIDQITRIFAFGGVAMPHFWIGLMLILIFGQFWGQWFGSGLIPTGGYASLTEDGFVPWFKHIFPPAFSIALGFTGITMRITRSSMIDEMNKDYVTTARSKGVRERFVVVVHALRNALLPVITVMAIQIGQLMNGIVVIEEVFAVPGMGRLLFQSTVNQDLPLVVAMLMIIGTVYLVVNLVVDLLYTVLDPRIEY